MKRRINKDTKEAFLTLVRSGIGNSAYGMSKNFDWHAIWDLACEHGLSAVVLEGIESFPEHQSPPKELLLHWIGEVLHDYENRYESCCHTIADLAAFYNGHGYKMMVLKGYACSLDWPKPKHRPCGDIDIWLFGKQKDADKLIAEEKGVKVDTSHHHHTVFYWRDFMVENHYDFINVHHHKSNVELEDVLKELGKDDSHSVDLLGEKIYMPSPNLHALFLMKHLMMHFASEGIMLRQVVDWGFFVEKHGKDVDWNYVLNVLDQFGMRQMFNIINAICVGDLGFDVAYFPTVQFEPNQKDRVLNEILVPKYSASVPNNIFSRVAFKLRRWRDNEWKHQLCYKDSMWSAFWSGVWNHLLKPSSI